MSNIGPLTDVRGSDQVVANHMARTDPARTHVPRQETALDSMRSFANHIVPLTPEQ